MRGAHFVVAALVCQPLFAAEYGDWSTAEDGEVILALTANASDASFGLLCKSDACGFFVTTGDECLADGSYPLLINAPSSSLHAVASCFVSDEGDFYLMIEDVDLTEHVAGDGQIGFAWSLLSGQFAVSRFSLDGAKKAVERVLRERERLIRRSSSSGRLPDAQVL